MLDPTFIWPLQFCAFTSAVTWVASVITGNASQVDRIWTFMPVIYAAYHVFLPLFPSEQLFWLAPFNPDPSVTELSPRALLMFSVLVVWMVRLSYNTYRRGLFNLKDEDYRWVVLRTQIHPILFHIVNFTFIAIIQNVLLLVIAMPVKTVAVDQPPVPLENSDIFLTGLISIVLLVEFTSDNQQFSFQTFKYDFLAKESRSLDLKLSPALQAAESYDESKQWPGARLAWNDDDVLRGFVTKGFWAYSRHPNFLCEQTFWWLIAAFPLLGTAPPSIDGLAVLQGLRAILASRSLKDASTWPQVFEVLYPLWPLIPPFCLTLLFFSSTAFTEGITAKKYPLPYAAYQRRVGMFFPSFSKLLSSKIIGRDDEMKQLIWGDPRKIKSG